jgi:hypothetical protein
MILFAFLGLIGYINARNIRFYPLDFHTLHAWIGLAALLLSACIFVDRIYVRKIKPQHHCYIGYAAVSLASIALIMGLMMLTGFVFLESENSLVHPAFQESVSGKLPEIEAREYNGTDLTPLSIQGNNAIRGTQYINRSTYRLKVTGMVENELNLSYDQILELPAYSEFAYMPCVEGWGFNAKWTGFRVIDLLNHSGLKENASYVVFHSSDGYYTGLPLEYLKNNSILMAYGINDVTLPPERGFPFQLVAKDRYGYKWAKWITEIEVTDREVRGYWESAGYSNTAIAGGPPFG